MSAPRSYAGTSVTRLVDASFTTLAGVEMYIRCATPQMAAEWLVNTLTMFGIREGSIRWQIVTVTLGADGVALR